MLRNQHARKDIVAVRHAVQKPELARLLAYVKSGLSDGQNKLVDRAVLSTSVTDLGQLVRVVPVYKGQVFKKLPSDFCRPSCLDNIVEIITAAERQLAAKPLLH